MAHCCSQCSFTTQFASALMMHKELHHDVTSYPEFPSPKLLTAKSETLPQEATPLSTTKRNLKLPTRSSSATRLFGKLKAKICKSKTLFSHPEEPRDSVLNMLNMSVPSDCTSKAMKVESFSNFKSRGSNFDACLDDMKESYGCHICSFSADRITVLDRHLLNHHKIGLDNLLKLVMAKTRDGLSEDSVPTVLGLRQPYYRQTDDVVEDDEFIIEMVEPKVKILKHSGTNTDLKLIDMNKLFDKDNVKNTELKMADKVFEKYGFEDNLKTFSNELDNMMKFTKDSTNDEVLSKMKVLNDCMYKFVDSSNAIRKVLDSKVNVRTEPNFNLKLDTPREWERAHSEKMDRSSRSKYHEHNRGEKLKISSESFYF